MRRFAIYTLSVLGLSVLAGTAGADELTFDLYNDALDDLKVEFYAVDSDRAWPGGDQVYLLEDDETREFHLECYAGEKICFGAWVGSYDDPIVYWGVGPGGGYGCEDCCGYCGDEPIVGDLY